MNGVARTRVGYAGGGKDYPTYRDLGDHTETLQVDFDPAEVSYAELLDAFWESHMPTRPAWSRQYASILFHHDDAQRLACEHSRDAYAARRGAVYTEILPAPRFWAAEDYHQKYYLRGTLELLRDFTAIYPQPMELMNSTAAARVNGYLGGYGTMAGLAAEAARLGLSPRGLGFLNKLVDRRGL